MSGISQAALQEREATSELFPTCNSEENCLGLLGRKTDTFGLLSYPAFPSVPLMIFPKECCVGVDIPVEKKKKKRLGTLMKHGFTASSTYAKWYGCMHLWTEGFNWHEDRRAFVHSSLQSYIFIHGLRMLCSNITKGMQSLGYIVLHFTQMKIKMTNCKLFYTTWHHARSLWTVLTKKR